MSKIVIKQVRGGELVSLGEYDPIRDSIDWYPDQGIRFQGKNIVHFFSSVIVSSGGYFGLAFATLPPPHVETFSALTLWEGNYTS